MNLPNQSNPVLRSISTNIFISNRITAQEESLEECKNRCAQLEEPAYTTCIDLCKNAYS